MLSTEDASDRNNDSEEAPDMMSVLSVSTTSSSSSTTWKQRERVDDTSVALTLASLKSDVSTSTSKQQFSRKASADRIRHDLLFQLGIRDQEIRRESFVSSQKNLTLLGNVRPFQMDLKYVPSDDDDEDDDGSSSENEETRDQSAVSLSAEFSWGNPWSFLLGQKQQTPPSDPTPSSNDNVVEETVVNVEKTSHTSQKPKKGVSFSNKVLVVPIPLRHDYSRRMRQRLWTPAEEIHENAQRNAVEFSSEGWNCQDVVEEDDMYICSGTQELIHPVHVQLGTVQTQEEQ
eukprot:scaffold137518_cov47-Attheya_sp.AAC.1